MLKANLAQGGEAAARDNRMRGNRKFEQIPEVTVRCGRSRGLQLGLPAVALIVSLAGCSDSGTVTNEAKLQQSPAGSSKVLAIIPQGSAIGVGDCSNGWCRVSWNGRDGYVLTKSVHLSQHAFRSTSEPDQQPEENDADEENAPLPDEATAASSAN